MLLSTNQICRKILPLLYIKTLIFLNPRDFPKKWINSRDFLIWGINIRVNYFLDFRQKIDILDNLNKTK